MTPSSLLTFNGGISPAVLTCRSHNLPIDLFAHACSLDGRGHCSNSSRHTICSVNSTSSNSCDWANLCCFNHCLHSHVLSLHSLLYHKSFRIQLCSIFSELCGGVGFLLVISPVLLSFGCHWWDSFPDHCSLDLPLLYLPKVPMTLPSITFL
jgi:hypothetical protein